MRIYGSFFAEYAFDDEDRMAMSDGYAFFDFWRRLTDDVKTNGAESRYQKLCKGAHKEYSG